MRLTRASRREATLARDESSVEEAPGAGGVVGRRRWFAVAAVLVACIVAAGIAVYFMRDASPPPLDRAQVGTIASGVVKKAVDDLKAEPAVSEAVYQQILPSLVEIETTDPSSDGEDRGSARA